jgi:DNA-binding response OmpR family regulator
MIGSETEEAGHYLVAIDDDAAFLRIVSRALAGPGFKVATTIEPEVFKTIIRDGNPTIVMVDLNMPKRDGIELLRFLSEQNCRAHVVILSGADRHVLKLSKDFGETHGLNMAQPLSKPIGLAELRTALRGLPISPP